MPTAGSSSRSTATPEADFHTNRTGFAILHPLEGSERPARHRPSGGRPRGRKRVSGADRSRAAGRRDPLAHSRGNAGGPRSSARCSATPSRWRTSATGATLRTRPMYGRSPSPIPYTLRGGEPLRQSVELRFEGTPPALPAQAGTGDDDAPIGVGVGDSPRLRDGARAPARRGGTRPPGRPRLSPAGIREPLSGFPVLTMPRARCMTPPRSPPCSEPSSLWRSSCRAKRMNTPAFSPALRSSHRMREAQVASIAVAPAGDLVFIPPGAEFPDTREFDEAFAAARAAFPDRTHRRGQLRLLHGAQSKASPRVRDRFRVPLDLRARARGRRPLRDREPGISPLLDPILSPPVSGHRVPARPRLHRLPGQPVRKHIASQSGCETRHHGSCRPAPARPAWERPGTWDMRPEPRNAVSTA